MKTRAELDREARAEIDRANANMVFLIDHPEMEFDQSDLKGWLSVLYKWAKKGVYA